MAIASVRLVEALRVTAARLEAGATYQWTHMGACNCGQLVQTLTARSKDEIHRVALERAGDWGEQSVEYCATSGLPIDAILEELLAAGLELRDVGELEQLSGPEVLATFPPGARDLDRRGRGDVVRYLRAWADLLEARLDARTGDLAHEDSGVHARCPAPPSDAESGRTEPWRNAKTG